MISIETVTLDVPDPEAAEAQASQARRAAEGGGSHRIVIAGDAGSFTDPDGFAWQAASLCAKQRSTTAPRQSQGIAEGRNQQ